MGSSDQSSQQGSQPTNTKTVFVTKTGFGAIRQYDNNEPSKHFLERMEAFFS